MMTAAAGRVYCDSRPIYAKTHPDPVIVARELWIMP